MEKYIAIDPYFGSEDVMRGAQERLGPFVGRLELWRTTSLGAAAEARGCEGLNSFYRYYMLLVTYYLVTSTFFPSNNAGGRPRSRGAVLWPRKMLQGKRLAKIGADTVENGPSFAKRFGKIVK